MTLRPGLMRPDPTSGQHYTLRRSEGQLCTRHRDCDALIGDLGPDHEPFGFGSRIIQDVPKRSRSIANRFAKNVSSIGMKT